MLRAMTTLGSPIVLTALPAHARGRKEAARLHCRGSALAVWLALILAAFVAEPLGAEAVLPGFPAEVAAGESVPGAEGCGASCEDLPVAPVLKAGGGGRGDGRGDDTGSRHHLGRDRHRHGDRRFDPARCGRSRRGAGVCRLVEGDGRAGRIVLARPGMALTLNGLIADRVADLLESEGLTDILIDTGKLRAMGADPRGGDWSARVVDGPRVPLRGRALRPRSP